MEYHGRRNRRGRDRRSRQSVQPPAFVVPNSQRRWSVVDGVSTFFIMGSLLAIIYLMLDYHCSTCNARCDLTNITRNIDDIAKNISFMKISYSDLEKKVMKFSHELPKIEGQLEILESIANTMEGGDFQRKQQDADAEKTTFTEKKAFPDTGSALPPKCGPLGNVTNCPHKKSKIVKD